MNIVFLIDGQNQFLLPVTKPQFPSHTTYKGIKVVKFFATKRLSAFEKEFSKLFSLLGSLISV